MDPFALLLAREMGITPEHAEIVMKAYVKAVWKSLAHGVPILFRGVGKLHSRVVPPGHKGVSYLPHSRGKETEYGGFMRVFFKQSKRTATQLYKESPLPSMYGDESARRQVSGDTGRDSRCVPDGFQKNP